MEKLLHYVWKHRLFPLTPLATTQGQEVEVIDPGLHNSNAGPDFFNAKVRIGGTLWVGNAEVHDKASEWYSHRHDRDAAYDNVVLHVVGDADTDVTTPTGGRPPDLVQPVPQTVSHNYAELLSTDSYPPCYRVIGSLPRLTVHSWMSALQTERLQQKTEAIEQRVKAAEGAWERAFFTTLARNFGFGVNGDAFEAWANALPLDAAAHHRDDPFQIEALFFGQAGLLNVAAVAERRQIETAADSYFQRLSKEYDYLAHKFRLTPMDGRQWRFLRLRPQNFPYIRIAQLVHLYCSRHCSLSIMADCETLDDARRMRSTETTPYWHNHYTFGQETADSTKGLTECSAQQAEGAGGRSEGEALPSSDGKGLLVETGGRRSDEEALPSAKSAKRLSKASKDLLIINTVVPMLYAYGRHTASEKLCHRAFAFLEELKAENNTIVRMWQQCGLPVENAGDSQALIQLKRQYCDRKDCLRCRFGYEFLKVKTKSEK